MRVNLECRFSDVYALTKVTLRTRPAVLESLFVLSQRPARLGVLLVLLVICPAVIPPAYSQVIPNVRNDKPAQGSDHNDETETDTPDPLGRRTPHGTLISFLQVSQKGDYKKASQYLQLSKLERASKGERLARQLHQLLDQAFVGRVGAVSHDPEGSPQTGVPEDRERIGEFRVDESAVDVELVHISDPKDGNVWLFSSRTLAKVPELSDKIQENEIDSELPDFLTAERFLRTPLWRWLAFVLFIPLAIALSWSIVRLLKGLIGIGLRWWHQPVIKDFYDSFDAPVKLIMTVSLHWVAIGILGLPLLLRDYYQRFAGAALVAGLAWLIFRLVNCWAERERAHALAGSGYRSGSIVLLGQRVLNVVIVSAAILVVLSVLGFDTTTALAGLGIGSIAIAFAAQKTLENLLGGISIIGDQVLRVGETCRIDDQVGVVEDISLRSTRIRTLDSAELSVPNGQLANMNIENLSRYDKNSFRTTIELQRTTSPDQLRYLLANMRALLWKDPRVDANVARVRLVGFGESSLDVEVYCLILTPEWGEFLAIREDLLLKILQLVADAGTELAVPSRALNITENRSSGQMRANEQEQPMSERRRG